LLRTKVVDWLIENNEFEVKEKDTTSEEVLSGIEEELGGEEEQEKALDFHSPIIPMGLAGVMRARSV
jgi:hypothetical protein